MVLLLRRPDGFIEIDAMQKLFLPSADGPYKTGYAKFHLVNAAHRNDSNKETCRTMDVSVWYPGDVNLKSKPVPYLAHLPSSSVEKLHALIGPDNVRKFLMDEMTGSFYEVEVSGKKKEYPVILFSPDVSYFPNHYTALMEYFASRGFFVFSVSHPETREKTFSWRTAEIMSRKIWKLILSGFRAGGYGNERSSPPVITVSDYQALLGNSFHTTLTDWAEDASFILDYLQDVNRKPGNDVWQSHQFFSSRLNLERVVLIGHGFGGLALHKILDRQNVSAHVLLGSHSHLLAEFPKTTEKPSLVITGDADDSSSRVIDGLVHDSFTDFIFYKHVRTNFNVDHLLSPRLTFNRLATTIVPFVIDNGPVKISAAVKAIL